MTDQQLLSRIADGDCETFEEFYDRNAPTLYAVLLKMLGEPEAADEALQDTFGQVWRTAGSFDDSRGTAIGWLISIGRSRALDRIRSEKLRQVREEEAGAQDIRFSPNGDQMTGFRHASLVELREAVRGALSEIPDDQRKTIELAYFKGMSQSEIARALGQPLGTVKTRALLAMKKLRARLKQFHEETQG